MKMVKPQSPIADLVSQLALEENIRGILDRSGGVSGVIIDVWEMVGELPDSFEMFEQTQNITKKSP